MWSVDGEKKIIKIEKNRFLHNLPRKMALRSWIISQHVFSGHVQHSELWNVLRACKRFNFPVCEFLAVAERACVSLVFAFGPHHFAVDRFCQMLPACLWVWAVQAREEAPWQDIPALCPVGGEQVLLNVLLTSIAAVLPPLATSGWSDHLWLIVNCDNDSAFAWHSKVFRYSKEKTCNLMCNSYVSAHKALIMSHTPNFIML